MKSEKGITLTSLVIYVIVATLLISCATLLSSYVASNMNQIKYKNKYAPEFNTFNMFFLEDIKKNKSAEVSGSKITFENGNMYEYRSEDEGIYKNNTKIAEQIKNVEFSSNTIKVMNTTKQVITVNITIGTKDSFTKEIEYVLKYW